MSGGRYITVRLTAQQAHSLHSAVTLAATCCEQDGPASIGWTEGQYRAVTNAGEVIMHALTTPAERTHS